MGIKLVPFSAANADQVLAWRNAPHVRANSLKDHIITRDAHLEFVASLVTTPSRVFRIVQIDHDPVAVLNVDVADTSASWGCYLSTDAAPRPGIFPMLIMIAGHIAFDLFGRRALHNDVLATNTAPQRMNAHLGIPLCGERAATRASDGAAFLVLEYCLMKNDWVPVKERLRRVLTRHNAALMIAFAENMHEIVTSSQTALPPRNST